MSTYVWIAVVIVFYSIIKGIWKVLNKRSEDATQVPSEAESAETVEAEGTPWWEENAEETVEVTQETTTKPATKKEGMATVRSVKNDLQEEEDDDDNDLDVDIDLSDPDDVTKAFIASEIFNKKY